MCLYNPSHVTCNAEFQDSGITMRVHDQVLIDKNNSYSSSVPKRSHTTHHTLMPCLLQQETFPARISPTNGLNTSIRNRTFQPREGELFDRSRRNRSSSSSSSSSSRSNEQKDRTLKE